MNKKQKKTLIRIIIAAVLMILGIFIPLKGIALFIYYLIPYFVIGYDVLIKAGKGVINRQPFDECFLMAVATIGAIVVAILGKGEYTEAIAVMLFYQIGEWFQSVAVGKSRRNISDLMDIRPDYANIENEDGSIEKVDPDDVKVGTIIVVEPGEKIPIDGIIESGRSTLNTSALTGESIPRDVEESDEVLSGCINMSGQLKIRTTKEFDESTASKILDLVENASSRKSRSEKFITKFARVYTPLVVYSALILAFIPPLVRLIFMGLDPMWPEWIYRALIFLVISCPCALVVSIPLSFFAGLGGSSREGILIKGSNYMEMLSQVKTVVFDKTGTLTKGVFEVNGIHHSAMQDKELLYYAAHVESSSSHPISKSLQKAYGDTVDRKLVTDIKEISGKGVTGIVDGKRVAAGNEKLMKELGIDFIPCHHTGTIVHVAIDNKYAGHILISDVVKAESDDAVKKLKSCGIKKTIMLSGDARAVANEVAKSLSLDEVRSELLPGDKVLEIERIINENGKEGKVAFVGDGINDAPVLSRADIGIAMGALGSDAAIEAADVVLMNDDPRLISKAIKISRKCMRIVYENIAFAIGVKFICLILGAVGLANMWLAVFADVGVLIIAVINAIRALFVKKL
ncbi:MAG: cadmium-translocating P-type ATPase [Butyrivibrio sp.]|uniref:heavy metal translocating P-type ATPase n=1 Tax=Butyrivibrio sp. TaxID=28121 RepID=UPI0025E317EC|nr:heavy metal translocating P-type ATPase [Butyrivibrio sp.]MCR5772738.1 cadmium-translocating P-type ATPase [Butyrivibrio sp.]